MFKLCSDTPYFNEHYLLSISTEKKELENPELSAGKGKLNFSCLKIQN